MISYSRLETESFPVFLQSQELQSYFVGVMALQGGQIQINLQERSEFTDKPKGTPRTLRIAYQDIQSLDFKRGIFRDKLRIEITNPDLLQGIATAQSNQLVLLVKKRYRPALKAKIEALVNLLLDADIQTESQVEAESRGRLQNGLDN
ncbi:hypothetical protein [Spirochaeta lutea]|uniref:Uncharacterized protein n=1 Tax=Spirochaeta lutea TaxID=1480694 RepID=A0A098QSV4_9SPIO|nr:hypothetical protein [Spirochaeta lutea]KGE70940.1 hypothetical protein DC28_13435 [Spirochaeta lutea]